MKTKHTKGEWRVETSPISLPFYSNIYSGDVRIAEVKSYGKDKDFNDATFEEKEANAKLIASAPDLLEALIELYDSLPDGYESEILPKVRKAIKKATE